MQHYLSRYNHVLPRERIAVSALFLLNGYILGNWAPKIPFFLERMQITESTMGSLILILGFGGLFILPITGYIMSKVGSQIPSRLFALAASFGLLAITLANNLIIAGIALFFVGAAMIGMDIAINGNVFAIEKSKKIKFMSSCHGCWSVGGIIGGITGGALIEFLGVYGHALFVTFICLAILTYAWPRLQVDTHSTSTTTDFRLPRKPTVYLLGIMSFLAVLPEGAVIDWSALYFIQELESPAVSAGYAFSAFSVAMATIRLSGDALRHRFGSIFIIRSSCFIGAAGMVIAGQANGMVMAMVGFAIAGIGIANMVPIVMSAAGNQEGVPSGIGISTVGFMSMVGIMSAPAVLGFAAEYVSFSTIFTWLAISFIPIFFMSTLVDRADKTDS